MRPKHVYFIAKEYSFQSKTSLVSEFRVEFVLDDIVLFSEF